MNSEGERLLGASRRMWWNDDGLHIGFFLPPLAPDPKQTESEPLLISFYIDTRPESYDQLYEYSTGAGKFCLDVNATLRAGKATFTDTQGLSEPVAIKCQIGSTGKELLINAMIPWSCFPTFSPAPGKTIAFGNRISKRRQLTVGLCDLDDHVGPDHDPEVLDTFTLSPDSIFEAPFSCTADEIIENGRPLLLLQWCEPVIGSPDQSTPFLQVDVDELSYKRSISLAKSVSERFRWWREGIPLDPTSAPREIHVNFRRAGSAPVLLNLPLKLCSHIKNIARHLTLNLFQSEGDQADKLFDLYCACALEVIQRLQTYPDSYRPTRRRYRDANNEALVESDLAALYRSATHSLEVRGFPGEIRTVAWRRPDNVVSPFSVYYPDSFDPIKPTSLIVHLHGYNRYTTRSRFVLKSNDQFEFYRAKKVQAVVISTYGAGNNYEQCGQAELFTCLRWAHSNLKLAPHATMLRGVSFGGTMALYLGVRMPGEFSAIEAVSGDPQRGLPRVLARNLGQTAVRLIVGGKESELIHQNRAAYEFLKELGVQTAFEVVPNVGHVLSGKLAPDPKWPATGEDTEHSGTYLFTSDPAAFDSAFGIGVVERVNYAQPATFEFKRSEGMVTLHTIDIRRLTFYFTESSRFAEDDNLMIDDQELGKITRAQPNYARDESGEWNSVSTVSLSGKSTLRPGHAADISGRNFVVIYGTQDVSLTPFLVERAHTVAVNIAGARRTQWSGRNVRILADTEGSDELLQDSDVYLIGNDLQNAVTARLRSGFPKRISDAMLSIGQASARRVLVLQTILPSHRDNTHYIFLEAGSSPLAYTGGILKEPNYDFVVCEYTWGWRTLSRGDFNADWILTGRIETTQ